jgi:hypothetical protein
MSSPNPVIVPTTSPVVTQLQGQAADEMVIYLTGTWGVGETCSVFLPTSTANRTAFVDPVTTIAVVLSPGGPVSAVLPGGFLYTLDKTATAAAAGIDVQYKPVTGLR